MKEVDIIMAEEGRKDDQSVWSGGQKPHGLMEEPKAERILRTIGS